MPFRTKARIIFLVLTHLWITAGISYGQSFDQLENAVYVYNFIKYTQWPEKKTIIQVGVIGNTSLEASLKYLFSKKNNNSIGYSVKHISVAEAREMDVVIVAEESSQQLRVVTTETGNMPILIISEKGNMGRYGACISFFIDEENSFKTSYQLSIKNYKQRRLTASEQILNNAVLTR